MRVRLGRSRGPREWDLSAWQGNATHDRCGICADASGRRRGGGREPSEGEEREGGGGEAEKGAAWGWRGAGQGGISVGRALVLDPAEVSGIHNAAPNICDSTR